ncbi:MAG: transglycosylase domain-containing protein, partial [Chloroflexi bacterium]|nr:transglycosylase domain-containing protein [Chloroflexota bacterium]
GILRALWINLRGGQVLAGGSTITQQLARNVLLDPQERAQQSLTRKLRESILAWRLARAYSKDQILALYLNQTYYGHLSHGVEAAAQTYFGKSARELSLAESALLAGLPQAPGVYDPLLDPGAAKARQEVVLGLMVKHGFLSEEGRRLAAAETVRYAASAFPIEAPHFVFYVWSQLEARLPPETLYAGLTITTSLDLDLTRAAEGIIRQQLAALACPGGGGGAKECQPAHATDGALVALDPHSGQILAMVGSPDYFDPAISGSVNMAVAPRQPGSALKPLIYAAAFDPALCAALPQPPPGNGHAPPPTPNSNSNPDSNPDSNPNCPWTPATMVLDVKHAFVTKEGLSYVPQNFDRRYHGPVQAREALASSLNVPAVIALDRVGLAPVFRLAGTLGLTTLTDADRFGLAVALGGAEVRMLELAGAYATFANGGNRVVPVSVLEIRDAQGRVIESYRPPRPEQALDPRIAYLITDILNDNEARALSFGTHSVLQIGRPAAVKTGTTTNFRDNWAVGYTPSLVAAAWVGNADNSEMQNISGVQGAGPIWHEFMRRALQGKPVELFAPPPGVVRAVVCVPSGLLPTPDCLHTRNELFLEGTVPTRPDDLYRPFSIDLLTGLAATPDTPPERRATRVYLVLPPEAEEWARANGLPSPPAPARDPGQAGGREAGGLVITSPDQGTVYRLSPVLPLAGQQIPLRAMAAAPLHSVTFLLDDRPLVTLNAAPFEVWWQLEPGQHRLAAYGVTPLGQVLLSPEVSFSVLP